MLHGLKQLGVEPDDGRKIEEFIERPYGLFVVTGPIGSGKTSTLYAALNRTKRPTANARRLEEESRLRNRGLL